MRLRTLLLTIALLAAPAQAIAEEAWRVDRVMGGVAIINPDRSWTRAVAGAVLQPGQTLATGKAGRAMLVKGAASMLVSPNTAMMVQPNPSEDGKVVVLQRSGRLDLDVEQKMQRYFSVETPYLAAVVKGTHFGVVISKKEAAVVVSKGLVQVDGFQAGQTTMVGPGQRARTKADGSLTVAGVGPKYQVVPSLQRPALLSATVSADQDASDDDTDSEDTDDAGDKGKGKDKGAKGDKGGKGDKGNNGNGNGNGNGGGDGGGKGGGDGGGKGKK